MSNSKPAKPYPGFPLFPHTNGQWAKKVKGRLFYFGRWADDPKGISAVKAWRTREPGIYAGLDKLRVSDNQQAYTLGQLRTEFLDQKRVEVSANELSPRTYTDYVAELERFVAAVGESALIASLQPVHFTAYSKLLIAKRKLGRHARKRTIAYVKAMLNWGAANGHYPRLNFGTNFVAPDTSPDAMRQAKAREGIADYSDRIATGDELDRLLAVCPRQFRAMVLLGVNAGIGPADIGRLRWSNINLESGRLDMARGKTGTLRVGYLWRKTRKALMRVAKLKHNKTAIERDGHDALVFITRHGQPFYREVVQDDGTVQIEQAVSGPANKLMRRLGLQGLAFYRLRHTMATLAAKGRDQEALDLMMGHTDRSIGKRYRHNQVDFARVQRLARIVYRQLWPKRKEKPRANENQPTNAPPMRIAG